MQKINRKEFHNRIEALQRAKKIFIESGLTNNISLAFEAYQEILADEHDTHDVYISTKTHGRTQPTLLDDHYIRPLCPECTKRGDETPLYLRLLRSCTGEYIPKGKNNVFGWKSVWECLDPNCYYEQYSRMSFEDWLKKLPKRKD